MRDEKNVGNEIRERYRVKWEKDIKNGKKDVKNEMQEEYKKIREKRERDVKNRRGERCGEWERKEQSRKWNDSSRGNLTRCCF